MHLFKYENSQVVSVQGIKVQACGIGAFLIVLQCFIMYQLQSDGYDKCASVYTNKQYLDLELAHIHIKMIIKANGFMFWPIFLLLENKETVQFKCMYDDN